MQILTVIFTVLMLVLCVFLFLSSRNDIPDESVVVRGGLWYTKTDVGWVIIKSDTITAKKLNVPNMLNALPVVEILGLSNCSAVEVLTIPKNVRSVSDETFKALSGLKSVTVDAENAYLESKDGVLYDKVKYTLIRIPAKYDDNVHFVVPENTISIYAEAFTGNENILSVDLPSTLLAIGDSAFAYCSRLATVTFSGETSLSQIGDKAFNNCVALRSFDIPKTLTKMGTGVFNGCSMMMTLKAEDDNDVFYTSGGVLFSAKDKSLVAYPCGKTETDYCVPNGIKRIEKYSFCGNKNLMRIELPESVDFFDLDSMTRCYALNSVFIRGVVPPQTASWAGYFQDIGFYVSQEAMPIFQQTSTWNELNLLCAYEDKNFAYIKVGELSEKYANLAEVLCSHGANENDLVVTGFWGGSKAILPDTVQLEDEAVKVVGYTNDAFFGFTLSDITFGKNVLVVNDKDFYGFERLKFVQFNESIEYIGTEAFRNCSGLFYAGFLDEGLYDKDIFIGDRAFYECESLNSIEMPALENEEIVVTIGSDCFIGCDSLTEVFLFGRVVSVEGEAIAPFGDFILVVADELADYYLLPENYGIWSVGESSVVLYDEYLKSLENKDTEDEFIDIKRG